MLGAIVGDIVGSIYEFNNIKTKDFPLFQDTCFFTDDTVMTIAVADAIMNRCGNPNFAYYMRKWGNKYPSVGYGNMFNEWLISDNPKPYNSFGNGSAMRVSPCGWMYYREQVAELARESAEITHNHPEGIKGAQTVAYSIWLARRENNKDLLRAKLSAASGYDLFKPIDKVRKNYEFDPSCQGTVPQAIMAFLESVDFEDAIRNAVSLGGDSDTLTAITGSIAEAAYEIPNWIKDKALSYLTKDLRSVYLKWEQMPSEIR